MDFQAKSAKRLSLGFTLMEVVVVLSIIGLLASISTSVYSSFKAHENLQITTTGIVAAIRHAQASAQSGKGDSSWGVEIFPNSTVIFKGTSYADRDASADQSIHFSGGVVASGLSEIVFAKVTGSTEDVGSIVLTSSYGTENIEINAKGTLTYQ